MSLQNIAQKACAYEIASEFVDGMDVLAIREATMRAVERGRKQYLPTLLEISTYRFMGHSMSDPGKYRTRAEIEKHQERDPIKLFAANLVDEKVADAATLEKIDKEAREEVEDAVRFAEDSPFPAAEELYTDVYSNPIETGQSRIIR
jgi:pyruvate dehydrogenase E1 component alpha subunit